MKDDTQQEKDEDKKVIEKEKNQVVGDADWGEPPTTLKWDNQKSKSTGW